ncbi:MAG TPA: RluA family pseudouridine synthase [Planctomycetes bacterium]|nr:RluA family pseudouridine synthase [Planctomycetota bacterium]
MKQSSDFPEPGEARPRDILYLDPHLLVLNKPAGLLTQQAPGRRGDPSLLPWAARLLRTRGEDARLFLVHRLDEETSGTLALARSREAKVEMERIFRGHRAERIYRGLVVGVPHPITARLESLLALGEGGVMEVSDKGQKAITEYGVLESFEGYSLLAFRLETGRRNQIRVQMADRGHPLVGDRKYGHWDPRVKKIRAPRCMLHASALQFRHPFTGEMVEVEAPLPADFGPFLQRNRGE